MLSSLSSTSSINQLFAKLDTRSQGYLEKSDLVSAFNEIASGSSTSAAEEVFAALDSDSDGKVTESEFSTTLAKLQEELDSQFNQMRMQGAGGPPPADMAGMPPPPPPANDEGFTLSELEDQLSSIGDSDSERASFITNITENFAAADSDGNGKVSFAEAQAYNEGSTESSDSASTKASAASSEARIMMNIMQLMQAYGSFTDDNADSSLSSLLSVSA